MLYKSRDKWIKSQKTRAKLLFEEYPEIEKAYNLSQGLRQTYNIDKGKGVALTKLAKWYNQVEESEFKSFNTYSEYYVKNYESIINYFENRSTNASAELFNAKIKAFRAQFRGVKNIEFFLFIYH